jgi:thioredoxin-related protein
MNQYFKYLLSISFVWTLFSCNANTTESQTETNTPNGIKWMTFEEAVKKAETDKNPKNIFIDFYTSWCGWCKVMDKQTFTDPNVIELMNKYFYPVKFDAEGKNPITFKGQQFVFVPEGRNGYHQLAAEFMQGKMSYPTFMFLNPKFEVITPISGFVKPEDFEPIVNFLGQNKYLDPNNKWEDFQKNYQRGQK